MPTEMDSMGSTYKQLGRLGRGSQYWFQGLGQPDCRVLHPKEGGHTGSLNPGVCLRGLGLETVTGYCPDPTGLKACDPKVGSN